MRKKYPHTNVFGWPCRFDEQGRLEFAPSVTRWMKASLKRIKANEPIQHPRPPLAP